MSIGKQIKEARKKKGMTQVQLADAAKISRSYLGDLEGDRYNPSLDTLQKIAAVLGTTSGVLLGEASLMELIAATEGNKFLMDWYEQQRSGKPFDPDYMLPPELRGWNYDKNKPTVPEDDGLSENQRLLMQFARTVPEDKADMVLRVMKSILGAE